MAGVDKNQAVIDYLNTCDYVKYNPLFFNFGNAHNNNAQVVIQSNDKATDTSFIDGSVLRKFTFNLLIYKSITYNPAVVQPSLLIDPVNENVGDMADVQAVLDWVTLQNKLHNFPDFGEDNPVESIEALTTNPAMNGVNASTTPPLATYNISIRIEYIDKTDSIWNK